MEKTDDNHNITMDEIIATLKDYGVNAERKSIYDDIETLKTYGLDIIGEARQRTYFYRLASRPFELAELKLLVDSVQSSKFMTAKKSNELIHKIESMASRYDASKLQRQVYVTSRIKTMNESIYYNVDIIHSAINANSKIKFQYFNWSVNKEMQKKKDGSYYEVSPWALSWDDENYYLIAYDEEAKKIKHYRVDKMLKIDLLNQKRDGKELFDQFDIAVYAKKMFGMFGGREEKVCLQFENSLAGVVIDRFGKDVLFHRVDEEHFQIHVTVAVSSMFYAWVMGLGKGAMIIGPQNVVSEMKGEIKRLQNMYGV